MIQIKAVYSNHDSHFTPNVIQAAVDAVYYPQTEKHLVEFCFMNKTHDEAEVF